MSGRKDRDYDIIIKGLQSAEEALENLEKDAKMLDSEADTASNELRDRVGQKDTRALKELAAAITNAVKPGIERIRELEDEMERQVGDFDKL